MKVIVKLPGLERVKALVERHYELISELDENLTRIEAALGAINITENDPPERVENKD